MFSRRYISALLLFGLSLVSTTGRAAMPVEVPDSIDVQTDNEFYDTLAVRSQKRWVYRLLSNALIVPAKGEDYDKVVDESKLYSDYEGFTIADIEIYCNDIFQSPKDFLEKTANGLHVVTRQRVVRKDLLFGVGDMIDADLIVRNLQLLRSRAYIYDAEIKVEPSKDIPSHVSVKVYTYDNWTIDLIGRFDDVRASAGVYDANFLGYGNRLSVTTNYDYGSGYGGTIGEYTMPNMFGTFFKGNILIGRDFKVKHYRTEFSREFIKTSDYSAGAIFDIYEKPYRLLGPDSVMKVSAKVMDIWAGKSLYIRPLRSSIYLMARYGSTSYFKRTDVDFDLNTAFHDSQFSLASLGVYREKFYTTSLVYGYGFKELIASGYNAELTGGYVGGEFWDSCYVGAALSAGGMCNFGYLGTRVSAGYSYRLIDNTWHQGVLSAQLRYFTNLIPVGRGSVREFVTINHIRGWRRSVGEGDILTFTKESGPRGFSDYMTGTNRFAVNTETVYFTPWHPLGFRMALFGFIDAGTIGYENNMFKNDLFTTIGFGIRLKNERLIFSTIQLQLGLAFGKNGFMDNEWLQLSTQNRMNSYRFTPEKPQTVVFK